MPARYKTVDREPLMLLPYNLKEWIPEDGTGDEQYHPQIVITDDKLPQNTDGALPLST